MDRPLVLHAVAVFAGCVAALIIFNNLIAGAAFSASFLGLFFFTRTKKDFITMIMFFLLGILSFSLYFSVNLGNDTVLRVSDKKYYYFIGEHDGRKILIKGNTKGMQLGQKIKAHGSFKAEMDYKKGIAGTFDVKSYTVEKPDLISCFYTMKRNMYSNFNVSLGDRSASLLMALCFGDAGYLTNSQMDEFNRLGVIHAISVSGFHMAVVYGVMEKVLGMKAALPAAFIYSVFTGMQAATMRAFLMILILKLSKSVYRNYDSISSLALAALILLVIKPWYVEDTGFMLSFLSTLGIILFYSRLKSFFYLLPQKLNETLSISLSAQLFSLPFTAFTLQQFSAGFILGNLVLLPFYSILVLLGNVSMIFSFSHFVFNSLCGYMSVILKALEGAQYLLLGICPEVQYFSWLYGIALLLIYLSFIFYKNGYKYAAFYPIFVILFLGISSFSFFPELCYQRLQGGSGIVINYKNQCILVCNYDISKVSDIYKLKEEYGVTRVVSNVAGASTVKISDMEIRVYAAPDAKVYNDLDIYMGSCVYSIKSKYVDEYSDLYVIILNRLFHFS